MLATLAVGGTFFFAVQSGTDPLIGLPGLIGLFFGCALIFGALMTLPIGGADMPVVISIYNVLHRARGWPWRLRVRDPALMIAGMVVGAAGMLLTLLMAKAMNWSVSNVLFTNFGGPAKHRQGAIKGRLKPTEAGDAGIFMRMGQDSHCSSGLRTRRGAGTAQRTMNS